MTRRQLVEAMLSLQQLPHRVWYFLRAYPPLLALALLALALVIARATEIGLGVHVLRRGAVHIGVAAYLLGMVGFVALGRRNQAWPAWTQIGVACALGIAVALLTQIYAAQSRLSSQTAVSSVQLVNQCDASRRLVLCPAATVVLQSGYGGAEAKDSEAKSPLDGINALAAVLAVALAVLTLVAQKSASEARSEAEKAKELVEGAWDLRKTRILTSLALEAQRLRKSGREQSELYSMYEDNALDLANLHRRWSELYGAVSIYLVNLLAAVDSGEVDQVVQEHARIALMADGLDQAHRMQSDAAAHDLLREQVRNFVSPLRRLLSKGIEVVEIVSAPQEHQLELCKAMRALDSSLRVLT